MAKAYSDLLLHVFRYSYEADPLGQVFGFLQSSNNNFLKKCYAVHTMPDSSVQRLCIAGLPPASFEVSPAYQGGEEMSMSSLLFLDLEFLE